ncbi:probable mitogen-activated protein kinase kinase kinase 12 at C-terminar half [Coccomyxa sp. Obi]|nr:probable mitogen-activated protein kinase kinase kinase 12 at C-terminar half [Coccomyxa sp. Obi]
MLCERSPLRQQNCQYRAVEGINGELREVPARLLSTEPLLASGGQPPRSAFQEAAFSTPFQRNNSNWNSQKLLELASIPLDAPASHIVQSIHYLLYSDSNSAGAGSASGGSMALRRRSCELPRDPCSGCPAALTLSRQNSAGSATSRQNILPHSDQSGQSSGCTPSRQNSGCSNLPRAASLGCPVVPGLNWRRHIGSGSFARVYRGEWHCMQVAIKVLSSRESDANMTKDLFESLLSANMHHPNVVETYEVLTVEPLAGHDNCPMVNMGRSGSGGLQSVLERSGSTSSPAEAAAAASRLHNLASLFASHRASDQQDPGLAATNPQQPMRPSAFAPAAANAGFEIEELAPQPTTGVSAFASAAAFADPDLEEPTEQGCCNDNSQSRKNLRGILDRAGRFLASRSASQPLPLSPFDAEIRRALTASSQVGVPVAQGEAAGSGKDASAATSALIGMEQNTPDTERGSVRSSFEGAAPPGGGSLRSNSKASGGCCGEGSVGGPCSCALVGAAERPAPSHQTTMRHSFDCTSSSRSAKHMQRLGPAIDENLPHCEQLPPLAPPLLGQVSNGGRGGFLLRQSPLAGYPEGAPPARGPPGLEQPPPPPLLAQASVGSEGGPTTAGGSTPTGGAPLPYRPSPPQRPAQVLLLMELADQRSLHTAISKGRLSGNLEAILLCAMDIAAGMAYLHSMGIIHADLKPANVLLMSSPVTAKIPRGFTCKIADFGMSQVLTGDNSRVPVADTHGSLPYVAPEVLQNGELAKRADVYSFAVMLLEMWTGQAAYADENYHSVLFSAFSGRRPKVPDDLPTDYRKLLEDCWAEDSKARPSFEVAHVRLAAQLAAVRGHLTPNQATRLARSVKALGLRG